MPTGHPERRRISGGTKDLPVGALPSCRLYFPLNYQRNLPPTYACTYDDFSMSYQALLFCPDEKTARTVTQVLTDLEFEVDACVETFAAVKKLMGAHFDAVVVDCDNEQNATLLFKSARNSASNQASLAVAVVEGQAGVAKAFRIGANLVLTKPINIEQAKGTLRVARGLLRKGEPNKAVPSASAAPPSAPVGEVVPKSVMPPKPAQPPKPVVASQPKPPIEKPTARPAWPAPSAIPAAAAHASAQKSAHASAPREEEEEIPEILLDDSPDTPEASPAKIAAPVAAAPSFTAPSLSAPSFAVPKLPVGGVPTATKPAPKAPPARPSATFGGGAASAPAPAREPQPPQIIEPPAKPVPDAVSHPVEEFDKIDSPSLASSAPAPSFTFGGANVAETSGGSKKILTAVGILAIVAAGGYFGWTYSQRQPVGPAASVSKPATNVQPQPAVAQPPAPKATAAPLTQPASQPVTPITSTSDNTDTIPAAKPSAAPANKPSPSAPSTNSKADASETAPLIVKGGSKPAVQGKVSALDVSAPSVIGIGAGNSGELPPNIASSNSSLAPKPLLQRMSISQGVSQGLLIKKVQPVYPHNGLSQGLEGSVQLLATISKNGDITAIKVVSGDPYSPTPPPKR